VDTPKSAKVREEPYMARRKHLTETAKTPLGQATAGGVVASDPATQEATPETSSAVDQAIIAQTTLQGAIDDFSHAMYEAAGPKVQQPEVPDKGETLATALAPEQRAAITPPPPARKPGLVRNDVVASRWPSAVGWGGYGAFAFPAMYYPFYGYGYPYYGYGYGLAYSLAYNRPVAGYGYGYYGMGYPGWYWGWLRQAFC
jgi:hypothetical protein